MALYFEDVEATREEVLETRAGDDQAFGHTETGMRPIDGEGELIRSMVGLGLVEKRGDG